MIGRATPGLAAAFVAGAGLVLWGVVAVAAGGRAARPDAVVPVTVATTTPTTTPTTTATTTTTSAPTTTAATTGATTTSSPATDPARPAIGSSATGAAPTTDTAGRSPPSTPPVVTTAPVVTHLAQIGVLAPRRVAVPARVELTDVAIDAPVLPAGVDAAGELDIPPDARTLVWYRHGPTPGARGSAVIAGHLNWDGVAGVFESLAATAVGARIAVTYDDGSRREFVVTAVELVPKPAVAMAGVFARDGRPLLRLVTCGGEFDDATRHYRSNVVVTAEPA